MGDSQLSLIVIQYESRNGGLESEAVRFTGQNGPELAKWCGGTYNISGKFKGPNREVTECIEVPYTNSKGEPTGHTVAFRGDYIHKFHGEGFNYIATNSVSFHQSYKEKKGF